MKQMTLYARKEPTTDEVLLKYAPHAKRRDVVLYVDRRCTQVYARQPWYQHPLTRKNKEYSLNSYTWRLEWMPDKD